MNIIIDNRIVSDKTFATRFLGFLKGVQVNDPASYQELGYLRRVAKSLLLHQANTVKETEEKQYLQRCHPELKSFNEQNINEMEHAYKISGTPAEPKQTACPKCGEDLLCANLMILESDPPQKSMKCSKCDYTGYGLF